MESFAGALVDLVAGRGGDGVPHSSAESYVQTDPGLQHTDIHINADSLTLRADQVNVVEQTAAEAASVIEPAPDYDRAAWERAYGEAANDNGISMGR